MGMKMVEIGSGTGSSTLAFAHAVGSTECYELDNHSTAVALERLAFWGIENVYFNSVLFSVLFDEECPFVQSGSQADGVILFATLEHMAHEEALRVLSLSWRIVRPGGIIIVADTPNRFSIIDQHTSWLPFFAQLPRAIQVLYSAKSPREQFRRAIADASKLSQTQALNAMVRWGSGISFHEFELAIGDGVHEYIVLDGYEPEIARLIPISEIDTTLKMIFHAFRHPKAKPTNSC
jgi:ubiquinone/menaquinone biosynthesis C-methylase UbiE